MKALTDGFHALIPATKPRPHIALACDFLLAYGGAERVLQTLVKLFPGAPIYTLLANDEIAKRYFPHTRVIQSHLKNLPRFLRSRHRLLLPLYPVATERIDLREFDVVISSTSSFMRGLILRHDALHISYTHAPTRYCWDWYHEYLDELGLHGLKRRAAQWYLHGLRIWDRHAAQRPDVIVVNSPYTRDRVKKYYGREATIVPPPLHAFAKTARDQSNAGKSHDRPRDYCLVVSRLTPYKRINLAIEACNSLQRKLIVIGTGPQENELKKIAGPTITFTGFVADEATLSRYYADAKALIFPGEDDFGLTMIEAMAHGTPVIAFGRGGAFDIVTPGRTGILFREPTAISLARAIEAFETYQFDSAILEQEVGQFAEPQFMATFQKIVDQQIAIHRNHHTP